MSLLTKLLISRSAEKNLSQIELARLVGVSGPAISMFFSGRIIKFAKWRELATALEIDHDKMLELTNIAAAEAAHATKKARAEQREAKVNLVSPPSTIVRDPFSDVDYSLDEPAPATLSEAARLIPVVGEPVIGENGQYTFNGKILDYVPCPVQLYGVPGAYATYVDGIEMYPRYKTGEIVWLHPTRPARPGDDVMVQMLRRRADVPNLGYLRQFVRWDGNSLHLTQYNGGGETVFQRPSVAAVHVIVFSSRY